MGNKPGRPRKNPVSVITGGDRVLRPSLASEKADPFKKFKTEPDKFYYRAINTRESNVRVREAQGYQTIGGSQFGDLVLAKIPREQREAQEAAIRAKNEAQREAVIEQFKEEAARHGVESYEET